MKNTESEIRHRIKMAAYAIAAGDSRNCTFVGLCMEIGLLDLTYGIPYRSGWVRLLKDLPPLELLSTARRRSTVLNVGRMLAGNAALVRAALGNFDFNQLRHLSRYSDEIQRHVLKMEFASGEEPPSALSNRQLIDLAAQISAELHVPLFRRAAKKWRALGEHISAGTSQRNSET